MRISLPILTDQLPEPASGHAKLAFVACVGCEQRQLDGERVRRYLAANGFGLVDDPALADVAVLVTCAVDERNEADSMRALHDLSARVQPGNRVLVGGCLPSISPARLVGLPVAGTFSPRSMDRLDELLPTPPTVNMRLIADPNVSPFGQRSNPGEGEPSARMEYDTAKRGFTVRLNHGCLLACSYCVIRQATGRLQSVPVADVVEAFRKGVYGGEPSIMLAGGDTGAYGLDIGTNFASLLEELLTVRGRHRVFIHDFNINWLLRDLDAYKGVIQGESSTLRAACLPVQSGSDSVLRRMKRPYRCADVIDALCWLKEHAPHVALGTHIIAGFPGETEADFCQTLLLLREIAFDFVTCFRYSEHPSAPSATLDSKVGETEKVERLERLRELLGERATVLT